MHFDSRTGSFDRLDHGFIPVINLLPLPPAFCHRSSSPVLPCTSCPIILHVLSEFDEACCLICKIDTQRVDSTDKYLSLKAMAKFLKVAVGVSAALVSLQLFSPSQVQAAEKWVSISQEQGVQISIDANSIKKRGSIAWFWLHIMNSQVKQGPQQMLIYASADCRGRSARIRKMVIYNERGQALNSADMGDDGPLNSFIPNNDPVLRYVCR